MMVDTLTTIPVKVGTKKKLESLKGKRTWDDLLEELANTTRFEKRVKYRRKMGKLLDMRFEEVKVRKWAREY